MDGGAWWATAHGVAKSRTQLSDFTFTFHFHALEKEMATHSSVLAWRIPGTGEPGRLPSMGLHRVGHDWSNLAAADFITIWFLISIFKDFFLMWANFFKWGIIALQWRVSWESLFFVVSRGGDAVHLCTQKHRLNLEFWAKKANVRESTSESAAWKSASVNTSQPPPFLFSGGLLTPTSSTELSQPSKQFGMFTTIKAACGGLNNRYWRWGLKPGTSGINQSPLSHQTFK